MISLEIKVSHNQEKNQTSIVLFRAYSEDHSNTETVAIEAIEQRVLDKAERINEIAKELLAFADETPVTWYVTKKISN